jgi:hypothetical protein
MSRTLVVRLLLTAVAVVCEVLILLRALGILSPSELPFAIDLSAPGRYVIEARSDWPLPPSLMRGDVLVIGDMAPADRAIVDSTRDVRPDMPLHLAVLRQGRLLRVSVATIPAVVSLPHEVAVWIGGFGLLSFVLVLAMLTLWRGHDWAAWGLSAFSFAILVSNALFVVLTRPPASFWLRTAGEALQLLGMVPGLYVMAEALARTALPAPTRMLARVAMVTLTVLQIGGSVTRQILLVYFAVGWSRTAQSTIDLTFNIIFLTTSAVPVLLLLTSYRRADHRSKLRIRWVLWSTALLFATFAVDAFISQDSHPYNYQAINIAQALALLGYLYAVLRTRLVDVAFVIDRALVFALLAALLFGLFALVERFLHHFAIGEQLDWAVEALTVLLLAMAMSPLHRRLEHWIEGVLFRQQRLAVATLKRFATECAFVEREERLLDIAIEQLQRHCAAAAVYERSGPAYQLRAGFGQSWPQMADTDDLIFVSLRAGQPELNLEDVKSTLATEGFVFPMRVAEALTGAVICRPKDGEQFASDVRAVLAEVARSLGISLYILRYREQARLVADIASERIDEVGARRRAIALLQGT